MCHANLINSDIVFQYKIHEVMRRLHTKCKTSTPMSIITIFNIKLYSIVLLTLNNFFLKLSSTRSVKINQQFPMLRHEIKNLI